MMMRKLAAGSIALAGILPVGADAAPTVYFKAPRNNSTLSGTLNQSSACEVGGSGIERVRFQLDGHALNTEEDAPWQCSLDTRKFSNGSHTLRAVAYDRHGASRTTAINVWINNSGGGGDDGGGSGDGGSAAPTVSFKAPLSGQTVSGYIWSGCEVTGSNFNRVEFSVDGTPLNTKTVAPWNCDLKTPKFPDGQHTLQAVAKNTKTGASSTARVTLTFKNGNASEPEPQPDAPKVSFKSPLAGQTLSGYLWSACEVVGSNFNKVEFSLDGKPLNTKNVAPWNCNLKTPEYPDGAHTLMAVATNTDSGAKATTQISVNFRNGNDGGGDDEDPGTPGGGLPSTGTRAVPTFESLGLYWKPGSNPGSAGCEVKYRKQGDSAWKQGLNMWYDSRNAECRGSLVHLSSGTSYEVQFALPGKSPSAGLVARTWSDSFPIAKTVNVSSGSGTLNITQGGTKDGYVLYTGPATLDAKDSADHNIVISAPYVIVRGLTLKGAKIHGIKLVKGAHDVVIENNDISGWGRWSGKTSSDGWKVQTNMDSGIYASCYNDTPWLERLVVQRNRIHHPRYGSNSWSDGHPLGGNAVHITECGGNHVFRFNEIYSQWGRYFMDGFGGGENFSNRGMPNADSDIYGNRIQHTWDDAIEAEGANVNVRVWRNYMDRTATGIASTSTSKGPIYIWRNVWNRSRNKSRVSMDQDNRLYMFKSGSASGYGNGRRYVFHNTMLQAPPESGSSYPQGGGMGLTGPGGGQNLSNTVSRNNIFHIWKTWWASVDDNGMGSGAGNDLDFDLVNGNVNAYSGAERNRVVGTPIYKSGHGWSAEANGWYQLAPNSPGYDRGVRIPNFNDNFTGAAPDMGAHEAGAGQMKFGVGG